MTAQPGWYAAPWKQAAFRWFDGAQWTGALRFHPGWYADPWQQANLRWYDGCQWTTATQDTPHASADPVAASSENTPATGAPSDADADYRGAHQDRRELEPAPQQRRPPAILESLLGSADTVVVVDVETTGLGRSDRVIEIAMITLDVHGATIEEFSTLINPHRDVGPTWIHGLTAGMLSSAPSFADVSAAIASRIDGAVFAAHNAPFDIRMLTAELTRSGIQSDWGRTLDTLSATGRKLGSACADHGIMLDDAHSALADARATAELLVKVATDIRVPGMPASTGVRSASPIRVQTRNAGNSVHHPTPYLVELAKNLVAEPDVAPYSILLDQALADLQLTAEERAELAALAEEIGLEPADMDRAHRAFLNGLVDAALEDSIVTDEELDRLTRVAVLLELPSDAVTARTLEYRLTPGTLTLEPSLRICFTGDGAVDRNGRPVAREDLESAAISAGMEPVGSVTMKKCDLLVAVDPVSFSAKAKKAHRYGTPIATVSDFVAALQNQSDLPVVTMRSAGVASVCERCGDSWTSGRRTRLCSSCRTGDRAAATKASSARTQPGVVELIDLIACTQCSRSWERPRGGNDERSICTQCS